MAPNLSSHYTSSLTSVLPNPKGRKSYTTSTPLGLSVKAAHTLHFPAAFTSFPFPKDTLELFKGMTGILCFFPVQWEMKLEVALGSTMTIISFPAIAQLISCLEVDNPITEFDDTSVRVTQVCPLSPVYVFFQRSIVLLFLNKQNTELPLPTTLLN